MVRPSTQVVCLGVLIDSIKGTIQISPQKLKQILDTVHQWSSRSYCSKRQLQSLLGLLLFVHKGIKPARIFLNRMLMMLRQAHVTQKIELNQDFKRDLKWFEKFLPLYNGISLYQHKNVDSVLDLDTCLTGLCACWGHWVYHLPLQLGYGNYSILHLEMVNIFLALKVFRYSWQKSRRLIRCDNQTVVTVLNTGKTRDPYLAACARNV